MARKLEWELSGKSDVPQKIAEAKNAMAGLEGASRAMSKKFAEAFKDIAIGFLAPVALLHTAINLITTAIENRRQQVQDALDFADKAEAKLLASNAEIEAAKQAKEKKERAENEKKAAELKVQARIQFLQNTPEGQAYVENMAKQSEAFSAGMSGGLGAGTIDRSNLASVLALNELPADLKAQFEAFYNELARQRAEAEAAAKATPPKENIPQAQKVAELSSNVVGVGMSPHLEALKQQTEHLQSIDMSLREIVNAGATKSNNLTEKGHQGGQSMSGFFYGSTGILGRRISR